MAVIGTKEGGEGMVRLWIHLSEMVRQARRLSNPPAVNGVLADYVKEAPQGVLAPALLYWMGDNLLLQAHFREAIEAYQEIIDRYRGDLFFLGRKPWAAYALEQIAICHDRLSNPEDAIATYKKILTNFPQGDSIAWLWYRIGLIQEEAGKHPAAIAAYREAQECRHFGADENREIIDLADRAAARLEQRGPIYPSPEQLAGLLADALRRGDADALAVLASPTHFCFGPAAGELDYVTFERVLPLLRADLSESTIHVDAKALQGRGATVYLTTHGWNGAVLGGRVLFVLARAGGGWQWTGIGLTRGSRRLPPWDTQDTDGDGDVAKPDDKDKCAKYRQLLDNLNKQLEDLQAAMQMEEAEGVKTDPTRARIKSVQEQIRVANTELEWCLSGKEPPREPPTPEYDFSLKAPWKAGDCWRAGGLNRYLESYIPIYGQIMELVDTFSDCGYGPGGFYYDQNTTHKGIYKYAIDFTRYQKGLPNVMIGGLQWALAAHHGVVSDLRRDIPTGDKSDKNFVELDYLNPDERKQLMMGGSPQPKYRSRYLHLDGPNLIPVSVGMWVWQGTILGFVDDTGQSVLTHLHFELRDRDALFEGAGYASVPPSPMDGQSLGDDDGGSCICSSNNPI
jgi:tetratricopeptide (TPR) repeat protein